MSKKIEKEVEQIILPIVEQMGFELADVEFLKEGGEYVLTAYIWNENGITVDDCEKVSVAIDPLLDQMDPIEQPYYLSISSCGLDRPFKKQRDFERNYGKEIIVNLYAPIDKKKQFKGILVSADEENIRLDMEGTLRDFSRKTVAKAVLHINF